MQEHLTVSEVTALVKDTLEGALGPLWVEGEISNFVAHTSGHFYFSLKDDAAQLRCVMFRGANRRLRFTPEDGLLCTALGHITVYARSGQYQLIVERMAPLGAGELQLAFERLKARLAAEGLFDPARKKDLPLYPETIGVVTSPTGAAIRDIIRVLRRRWPPVRIVLRPVRVQGAGAAEEIAQGLADLDRWGGADLIIVGRGGGSIEDLWAFNEEVTARAIAQAHTPVISAVGHEIDTTIADFVADVRAPTPSAAAEVAVPDAAQLMTGLERLDLRCRTAMRSRLRELDLRLEALRRSRVLASPVDRLQQESQRADELLQRCRRALDARLARLTDRVAGLRAHIEALGPLRVLERGYALVYDSGGRLLRSPGSSAAGDRIEVQWHRGRARCRIEEIEVDATAVSGVGRPAGRASGARTEKEEP